MCVLFTKELLGFPMDGYRVIVERLIIEKPHPWGLMFIFIELIRNPSYCFKEIFNDGLFSVIIQRIFNSLNIS